MKGPFLEDDKNIAWASLTTRQQQVIDSACRAAPASGTVAAALGVLGEVPNYLEQQKEQMLALAEKIPCDKKNDLRWLLTRFAKGNNLT